MDAVPVDENLFTGEDLEELEEELNTLDLEEWTSKLKCESQSTWQNELLAPPVCLQLNHVFLVPQVILERALKQKSPIFFLIQS